MSDPSFALLQISLDPGKPIEEHQEAITALVDSLNEDNKYGRVNLIDGCSTNAHTEGKSVVAYSSEALLNKKANPETAND